MASCPRCGHHLRMIDWKPNCPACGVNMVYYNSNERLLAETEAAEIAHAKFQPGVDRAKASTIGSKEGIIRIIISVLPLAAVFLPLIKVFASDGSSKLLNALGIWNFVNAKGIGNVLGDALKPNLIYLAVAMILICLVLSLVFGLLLTMSLGKHGKQRNLTFDIILLALSSGSAVCFALGADKLSEVSESFVDGKLFIGAFVVIALYLVLLVYNLVIAKKGIEVKHQPCLIGGLPADEYFKMVEDGVSELEIRKKMVDVLTEMQKEVRARDAEAKAKEEAERAKWK